MPSCRARGRCARRRALSSSRRDGRRSSSPPPRRAPFVLGGRGGTSGGAASISRRIVRAASRSSTARCSLPAARWASARLDAEALPRTGADLVPESHRLGAGLLRLGRASARRTRPRARAALATSACSRTGRLSAPARRRPIEHGRCRRPRSRSPTCASSRRSPGLGVGGRPTAPAAGARGHLGSRRPRSPRRLGPAARAQDQVAGPTRRRAARSASSAPATSPL